MSHFDDFGRLRPTSSTPPTGSSPNYGNFDLDGIALSYRSNTFRPPSPLPKAQQLRPASKTTDGPPFLKQHKVDFTLDEPITHLAAGLNHVAVAGKNKKVLIIDILADKQADCDLVRTLGNRLFQAKLHKLFLDPTGKFTLISLAHAADNQPMENLLHVKRIQTLPRLKGHLVSAVAWNYPRASTDINSNSTGTILLGTTKGLVLQCEFSYSDESKFFPLGSGPRQYVKEVFDVGPDVGAITGLEYHQIPAGAPGEKSYVIFVSTPSRLYRMVGSVPATTDPPPLHLIFAQNASKYQDVPGRFFSSKLDFYYPSQNTPPSRFAWLTEPGVMTGEILTQLSACREAFDSQNNITIVPYATPRDNDDGFPSYNTPSGMSPTISSMGAYQFEKPVSIVVTSFHVIILFRRSVKAICILNEAIVHEEHFPPKLGSALGMAKEPIKNLIWVYFENTIYRYKISNESKNIWKIYLNQKNFELARKYSANEQANYDRVICEEAQHYFRLKDYEKSAELFAKSKKAFEEVSLMFMETNCSKALQKYLMIHVEQFEPNQRTQLTMTLAWLLEIIISRISIIKAAGPSEENDKALNELNLHLGQLFESKQVVDCLRQYSKLFYDIIRNYSELETFVRVANLIGDYENVVQYHIETGDLEKALAVMRKIKKDDLFYSYGYILMKRIPKELVDALKEQPKIDPERLLPVLIQENPYYNKCAETIRYFEFCINERKNDSQVIHNYLFELYARHRDEQTLIEYLEREIEPEMMHQCLLDLQLCLRLCTEMKLNKACVTLYSLMGLNDEAIELALEFDLELAKKMAKRVNSEDHQKRLWLTIVQNVLSKNADIKLARSLLQESRLLKIEDILPFFPDYKTIDFFKDAVRQSLQEYKNQIMSLKDGTYDHIADEIRSEIKAFRNRYSIVKANQRCESCSKSLIARSFYVFPCGHLFHSDCIIREIINIDPNYRGIEGKLKQITLEYQQQQQPSQPLQQLQQQNQGQSNAGAKASYMRQQNFLINSMTSTLSKSIGGGSTMIETNRDQLVSELDQIISSECVYCGSLLPSYIEKPPPSVVG